MNNPYYVRLLTPSEKVIPCSEIMEQVPTVRLAAGMDREWERLEVLNTGSDLLGTVEREPVSPGSTAETEIAGLKEQINEAFPESAREWLHIYLSKTKTIYAFRLYTENITTKQEWQILGKVQNFLKDSLGGIIQADNEGYYNEAGDYILWQMYSGSYGTIPAATLDENGHWVSFQLKLDDPKSIERFKQGEMPHKGFWDILLGR